MRHPPFNFCAPLFAQPPKFRTPPQFRAPRKFRAPVYIKNRPSSPPPSSLPLSPPLPPPRPLSSLPGLWENYLEKKNPSRLRGLGREERERGERKEAAGGASRYLPNLPTTGWNILSWNFYGKILSCFMLSYRLKYISYIGWSFMLHGFMLDGFICYIYAGWIYMLSRFMLSRFILSRFMQREKGKGNL